MFTVWKFPFVITGEFKLDMPEFAIVKYVACQGGVPCLWAEVNSENKTVERTFYIVGTGHPFPNSYLKHIATFMQDVFVWHLYEEV